MLNPGHHQPRAPRLGRRLRRPRHRGGHRRPALTPGRRHQHPRPLLATPRTPRPHPSHPKGERPINSPPEEPPSPSPTATFGEHKPRIPASSDTGGSILAGCRPGGLEIDRRGRFWAEIRRLYRAERMGIKTIVRRLGVARNTARAALRSDVTPPRYERTPRGSVVEQILERLASYCGALNQATST